MNTTKGGSEQGQDNGFKPTVTWHKEPGYFYEEDEEVEKDSNKPGAVALNAPKSTELHHEAQVNLVNSQDTKEIMTTTQNKNNKVAEDAVENDSVDVGVSQKDIKDWQSTLSEEKIAKAFNNGATDDYGTTDDYNNSGVVPVNHKNESNLQSSVKNLGNLGEEMDVMGNSSRGTKLPDDIKLSGSSANEQTPEHGLTKGLANERVTLEQGKENILPKKEAEEVIRLKEELSKAQEQLSKEKLILERLLADQKALSRQTGFLDVKNESVDSLVKEIRNKKSEISQIEEGITKIEQQITEANQAPEQAETPTQEETTTQVPQERIVQESEGVIGLESDLIDKGNGEDSLAGEGVDETAEGNNIETLENGKKVGEIGDGQTLLWAIQELVVELNKDDDIEEAEGMSLIAFENFRIKYLNKSVNKGMTKEEALSSWKDLLASLSPGDKVVVGLSEQGIELDIPAISGSEASTDKVVSNNTVADDYNYAQAA